LGKLIYLDWENFCLWITLSHCSDILYKSNKKYIRTEETR